MNPDEKALRLVGEIEMLLETLKHALNEIKELAEHTALVDWTDVKELSHTKEKLEAVVSFYLGEAE